MVNPFPPKTLVTIADDTRIWEVVSFHHNVWYDLKPTWRTTGLSVYHTVHASKVTIHLQKPFANVSNRWQSRVFTP